MASLQLSLIAAHEPKLLFTQTMHSHARRYQPQYCVPGSLVTGKIIIAHNIKLEESVALRKTMTPFTSFSSLPPSVINFGNVLDR